VAHGIGVAAVFVGIVALFGFLLWAGRAESRDGDDFGAEADDSSHGHDHGSGDGGPSIGPG